MTSTQPAPSASPGLPATGRVRLRAITDRDAGFLYALMSSPQAGGRVRFGGATPSPEKVAASLWEGVLAQFVIEGVSSGEPLGLVAITSPNFRDGYAYLSALGMPAAQGSGVVAEGVLLGAHQAFLTWPFRKLYMEATADSFTAFRSGLDLLFTEEGRLRGHTYWNGAYVDLVILAIYRDTWSRTAPAMLSRLRPPGADAPASRPSRPEGLPSL